jgi:hypothetical protein
MGRPKRYTTAADLQAAYRRRLREATALVDCQALERLQQGLDQLQQARATYSATIETMLDKLTAQFHARATALTPVPPAPVIP